MRVALHGRRVRGWVTADPVEPATDPERLRPLAKIVGAGPPADVVDLCRWAAWRWAGPLALLLRAASPPNAAPLAAPPPVPIRARAAGPRGPVRELLVWPPAADRRALVTERLAPAGSSIVISPETARLDALARHLRGAGRRVLDLRGDRPPAERTRAWVEARRGDAVVLGGRSAVWAPVLDLAAVIVLDESDEALQEERAPTWHARDVAAERSARRGACLTLVSPAPSVDAVVFAGAFSRPARSVERDGWPVVEVVDRRAEPPGTGLLTGRLASALHRALDRGGRAVCVLNRRGRARLLACAACHDLARCERCGGAVGEAVDGERRRLRCPRCGTERPVICLRCHATRVRVVRPGVGRVRDDLAALLPRATVAQVDASTDRVPDAAVLVGTEAVLHRVPTGPAVRLVSFLDLDQELLAARFRAPEQALALVARAARLLGPRVRGGRLLLQTRLPDHEVVQAARRADPVLVLEAEQERRAALGYPPFGAVAELRGDAAALDAAAAALATRPRVEVLGPSPVDTSAHALVLAPAWPVLADALAAVTPLARAAGRVRVAVDPARA